MISTMKSKTEINKKHFIMAGVLICVVAILLTTTTAFADVKLDSSLTNLLETIIDYLGLIFRVVGILLLAYAVGQMILAFKDDNPDAKTKASTLIVVAFILISIKSILDSLNLIDLLTKG